MKPENVKAPCMRCGLLKTDCRLVNPRQGLTGYRQREYRCGECRHATRGAFQYPKSLLTSDGRIQS